MPETEPIDIYPDPPAIALYSYIGFGAFGLLHLILAALFDCLQMLNLVLGLLEILIAIWIFVEVSRWQKEHDARRSSRNKTQTPTAGR